MYSLLACHSSFISRPHEAWQIHHGSEVYRSPSLKISVASSKERMTFFFPPDRTFDIYILLY